MAGQHHGHSLKKVQGGGIDLSSRKAFGVDVRGRLRSEVDGRQGKTEVWCLALVIKHRRDIFAF